MKLCEEIRITRSKNMKVRLLSRYLSSLNDESLSIAVLFLSNRIFPFGSKFVVNAGFGTIMQALSEISFLDKDQIQQSYMQYGDMGALSEYAVSKKHTASLIEQQPLTLPIIHDRFKGIADSIGSDSSKAKKSILKGLFLDCSPLEAKYLTKVINGEMRIGLTEGLVEVAVSMAFNVELKKIREAMLVSGDISQVAFLARSRLLHTAIIKPLQPLSYMLADVMFTAEEIINYFQKPLICEYKYDGIRAQMHKSGQQVKLFSRNMTNITNVFPELVQAAIDSKLSSSMENIDFILDGEIMGLRNGKPLHFQELQKRLRRKNVTGQILTDVPIVYIVFDITYINQEQTIRNPLRQRKEILSSILFREPIINAKQEVVNTAQKIIAMFEKSRDDGYEGLVLKDPESRYHPGKRGRYWIKLKQELDTIDAVIVIAEYGHGKRAGVLSDYTFAVRDENDNNQLKIIGKAYSGLTDKEISTITEKLKSIMIKDDGYKIAVKSELILEISFDSIQKSDRHDSGFALRFPRIKNIRSDKNITDIDTLQKVRHIYENQSYLSDK
ncbi:MAG: ATP-dependent DNA ligase [Nitrososphaeraceae archaeon]|nr:ATP-dependent DNA ligase [Nitrososphaeraceae archaeon]